MRSGTVLDINSLVPLYKRWAERAPLEGALSRMLSIVSWVASRESSRAVMIKCLLRRVLRKPFRKQFLHAYPLYSLYGGLFMRPSPCIP